MPKIYDIAIIGGGLAGITLALALSANNNRGKLSICIIEANSEALNNKNDPRASALTSSTINLLINLELWGELQPFCQAVSAMHISDSELKHPVRPPFLKFNLLSDEANGIDSATHIIRNNDLLKPLTDILVKSKNIDVYNAEPVLEIQVNRSHQSLIKTSNHEITASLIVGADGANSKVRELAGIETFSWDYDQWGIVTEISLEYPHKGIALQHFLEAGPFAMLPLPDNKASMVWCESRTFASNLIKSSKEIFVSELQRRLGNQFGNASLSGEIASFPLNFCLARQFVGPSVALIGDAIHKVHPLAGQGFNLAAKDIAALSEAVIDSRLLGLNIASMDTLERYQRWRRFDTISHALAFDAMNRTFTSDFSLVKALRGFSMGLVDKTPELKSWLQREAEGQQGNIPKLLKAV